MRELSDNEVKMCSGGLNLKNGRESDNVIDARGYLSYNFRSGEILWGNTFTRFGLFINSVF